jgi:predicted RNA binding protein YcfA (HicA-like mRNA interferase family)
VTSWSSTKARRVYAALLSVGWQFKRQSGSHRTLSRPGSPDFVFAFHDGEEIGPKMLARIANTRASSPKICRREMPNKTLERTGNHRAVAFVAGRSTESLGGRRP